MGEILHLQYGNLPNFIMAHYWNIQDELIKYGHKDFIYNRLYTENPSTGFYTPRALIFDQRDNYGYYAPQDEREFDKEKINPKIKIFENEPIEKSLFTRFLDNPTENLGDNEENEDYKMPEKNQNEEEKIPSEIKRKETKKAAEKPMTEEEKQLKGLEKLYAKFKFEETTKYWIDYSQTAFNSSNRVPVPIYEEIDDVADYQNGLVAAQTNFEFREDYEEKFRKMLEKADLVAGISTIVEGNNSFAGIATETLQAFKQEIPKCPIMLFSIISPFVKRNKDAQEPWQNLNILMSINNLTLPLADVTIPYHLPNLVAPNATIYKNLKYDLPYHISALPAISIDSIIHQFCRKSYSKVDFKNWTGLYRYNADIKIAHVRYELPYIWPTEEKIDESVSKIKPEDLQYFSPMVSKSKKNPYFSYNILRALDDTNSQEIIEEKFSKIQNMSRYMKNTFIDENILLPVSYPRVFTNRFNKLGRFMKIPSLEPEFVTQIPFYENIYLTHKTGKYLKNILKEVVDRNLWMKQMISKGKILIDDWEELRHNITEMSESYASLIE